MPAETVAVRSPGARPRPGKLYAEIRNRLYAWLFRPTGPRGGVLVLAPRRVFILPTREGLVYAALLVMMVLGAINYTLSLGFALAFLLASVGVSAMIHTYRNLVRLQLSTAHAPPVFAGETAHFAVCIDNPDGPARFSIGVTQNGRDSVFVDVSPAHAASARIGIPAARRGVLRPGRLTLFTRYPLGLFRAWAYYEPDVQCVVYPRPAPPGLPLPRVASGSGQGALLGQGQDDFSGLRQYHAGDPPRHVAWKAAARGEALLTKQFSGRADTELWLDWQHLPPQMEVEERLSRLARWVLDAHASGVGFGLRLPEKTIDPGCSDAHRARCLEALARFDPDRGRDG